MCKIWVYGSHESHLCKGKFIVCTCCMWDGKVLFLHNILLTMLTLSSFRKNVFVCSHNIIHAVWRKKRQTLMQIFNKHFHLKNKYALHLFIITSAITQLICISKPHLSNWQDDAFRCSLITNSNQSLRSSLPFWWLFFWCCLTF